MTVEHLDILGSWVYTPKVFSDERGHFFEWFQDSTFREAAGNDFNLAQANCSVSAMGTLRGIHFADVPPGQRKYVTCITGEIMDVVVDLRKSSPTFGKWRSAILNAKNHKVMAIPNGVGHAFLSLEEDTTVVYLCDKRYNPSGEFEINPLDTFLGIEWPNQVSLNMSAKDRNAPNFLEVLESRNLE